MDIPPQAGRICEHRFGAAKIGVCGRKTGVVFKDFLLAGYSLIINLIYLKT